MGKTVLIVLAVLGALALTCLGALVVGGIWLGAKVGPPPGIVTSVTMPETVTEGESFDIVISVTNQLDRSRVIKDIDFYDPLLDGVRVVSVDPVYDTFDPSFGMATYTMELAVGPGETVEVTFSAEAETYGLYAGDIDVSVDSLLSINTTNRALRIEQAD